MSTNTRKIVKSGLWVTAGFVFVRASQLITQIFLARLLSPEDFGIWALVLLVTTLSSLFKDWAIAGVLVYRGLEDRKLVDAVYSFGLNLSIAMGVLQVLAGFALSHFFSVPILMPLTALVSLVFLIGAGAGSHAAVMQRQMQFQQITICEIAAAVARLAGAIICAAFGGGVWSFAVAEIASSLVDSVLKRMLSGYRFTYHLIPDAAAIKEVRRYIGGLISINLALYVNTNVDNLVIGRLLGTTSLGYYNLAYQLAMLPVFALSQINRVNFSVLSQQDNESQKKYVSQALELYSLFSAPIYGIAFMIAPWAIPLVYGSAWTAAIGIFQAVLVFAYARGAMSILGTALNALNKPGINAAINWVLVPISVPSYLLGAWLGGTIGVAISVSIVLGIAATLWFLLATCHVTGWNVQSLLQPVLLPILIVASIAMFLAQIPWSTPLFYLQPLLLMILYSPVMGHFLPKAVTHKLFHLFKGFLFRA